MKKFVLVISIALSAFASKAQNCPVISSTSLLPLTNNNWIFSMSYTSNGRKYIGIDIYCGAPVAANLISSSCIGANSTQFAQIAFNCDNPNPTIILTPGTGTCLNGTNCNPIQVNPGGGPVPLKLASFNAKRNNNAVLLNWHTEMEENVKEFIIERKSGDNKFIEVARVAATNNATGSSYTYTDNYSAKSIAQYRLKITELDGKFAYTEIKAVKGTDNNSEFTVYPNPSNGSTNIMISDINESNEILVIDNNGRVIKRMNVVGNNMPIQNLTKGLYMIRLVNKVSGESNTRKLIVN